jgi:hypothetical protein
MTRMTNTELQAALADAVDLSNWYFDDQNWHLAEYWHLRAVEVLALMDGPKPSELTLQ